MWKLIIVAFALYIVSSETVSAVPFTEEYWTGRIQHSGAERSYEEFARAVRDTTEDIQHESAHAFGGALFRVEGIGGLRVCDERFSYGCFHELIGRAIAREGTDIVAQLNEQCLEIHDNLKCQHGIGHGLVAWSGYEEAHLKQALTLCARLPHSDPVGGCPGGVFMEYDLRTMLGNEGGVRPGTLSDPVDVCARVGQSFLRGCAYWRPQWWRQVFFDGIDSVRTFNTLGELCTEFKGVNYVACIQGIATIIPRPDEQPLDGLFWCGALRKDTGARQICVTQLLHDALLQKEKAWCHV